MPLRGQSRKKITTSKVSLHPDRLYIFILIHFIYYQNLVPPPESPARSQTEDTGEEPTPAEDATGQSSPLSGLSEAEDVTGHEEDERAQLSESRSAMIVQGATPLALRRSDRRGKGQGGTIARAERIYQQIEHIPRKRSASTNVIESMLDDPDDIHAVSSVSIACSFSP